MLNIIKKRKIWFSLSGVLVLASIIVILLFGLNLGIDFTGGSLSELGFSADRPDSGELETVIENVGISDYKIQPAGDNDYLVRMESIDEEKHQELVVAVNAKFQTDENEVKELRFESIGPTIGNELKTKAVWATLLVLISIVLFVAYTFRKVSTRIPSWKFGICAIIALTHDIMIVLGIFVVLGRFMDIQIDSLFVIALLTVLGYSVNDSIVVFDRIRYNVLKNSKKTFSEEVETSLGQTMTRSLNTSITTLLVLTALFLFGGASIQYFVLALMIGVVAGTYSSIFIASPILVEWEKRK